ncbi:hypothetical protein LUX34_24165 [Streptomyces werraensis]|nr:hypothetical protein [Streptomyces werraensis]
MAKDYESEALAVIDGTEVSVYARFTVFMDGPIKSWHGSIASEEPGFGFKATTANRVVLRMPDGKEGAVIPTHSDGGPLVSFTGSGPAPV